MLETREGSGIGAMFDAIASRYDVMNRLMTAGRDGKWRRLAADETRLSPGQKALDVATGTGDMAVEVARRVIPGGEVVGLDIADQMMEVAKGKIAGLPVRFVHGDVHDMTEMRQYHAVTVAFGLRNFANRERAVTRIAEALLPRGRLVILELVPVAGPFSKVVDLYEQKVIPFLGRLVSRNAAAYTYLPRSVKRSVSSVQIETLLRDAGLVDVRSRLLNFGTVGIISGTKPGTPGDSGGFPSR